MKVTVKTDYATNNMEPKVEIYFSSKPDAKVLADLKNNRWWWITKKKCWSKRFNKNNLDFAMNLSNTFNNEYQRNSRTYKNRCYRSNNDEYEEAFSYLRAKHPMRKRNDYGERTTTSAITTSQFDVRTRLVSCVS